MAQGMGLHLPFCLYDMTDPPLHAALTFTSDFKLGHYMKIPPRAMFWAQVIATIIAGTVQLGVQQWMFSNIPDMCQKGQSSGFICPSTETFYTASVVWGVIGPARQFSQGQIYYGELYTTRPGCYVFLTQFYVQVWCSSSSAVLSVRQLCTSIPGNTPIALSETSSMTQLLTMCLCVYTALTLVTVFRSSSLVRQPFLLPPQSTMYHGRSLGSSSNSLSGEDTSLGGRSTTTSYRLRWTLAWPSARCLYSSRKCYLRLLEARLIIPGSGFNSLRTVV